MRNAFADEITNIGVNDSRVVLLSGDIGNKLFDNFKGRCSERRLINCGIAEANMMGVAAGMAMSGLRPVIYTIAPFTTTRCYEQIRVGVSYHNVPVTIVGTGSGLSYAELGPTHHSLEDMAILRLLPNMLVLAPCDEVELRAVLRAVLAQDRPAYIRIGKKGERVFTPEDNVIRLGLPNHLRDGDDVCIIVAGTIVSEALGAANLLENRGYSVKVISNHTIKPLNLDLLSEVFERYSLIAIVEEHGKLGGLAGAISEWRSSQKSFLTTMLSFGTEDHYMHKIGTQEYARGYYKITGHDIAEKIEQTLRRKGRFNVNRT